MKKKKSLSKFQSQLISNTSKKFIKGGSEKSSITEEILDI